MALVIYPWYLGFHWHVNITMEWNKPTFSIKNYYYNYYYYYKNKNNIDDDNSNDDDTISC